MKIAALYDIHGNLPALEAVLQEIERSDVNQIVAGGDIILGPMSRECLDRLLTIDLPVQFIQGNCEISVLAEMTGKAQYPLPKQVLETIRWTADQLNNEDAELMASWPKTFNVEIPGLGTVLFCHATPRNENECFTKLTPEEKLLPIFNDLNVDLVICGHTHMQFDRMVGSVRVVNAGSIGMPFGKPCAHWLLLEPDIKFKHTTYDLIKAADTIQNTGYPQAKDFASNNILNPPSEEKMLEVFARVELKV
jgi:putative phosphoesterase